MADTDLLLTALEATVPLHIEELKKLPYEQVLAVARECGQVVAEKGDVIQYRSKREGETAKAFNALARGVAALSFSPGGVEFMGVRFEAQHPDLAPKGGSP